MKTGDTKLSKQSEMQTIVDAIKKHLKTKQTVTLNGVNHSVVELTKKVEQFLGLLEETSQSRNKWRRSVADERAAAVALNPLLAGLRNFVTSQFGESSAVFGEFGYKPRKVAKRSIESKARAVQKQRATRASHHVVVSPAGVNGTGNGTPHS